MAFLVEDGSGVEGANSYVDLAFADEYHSDRDHRNWSRYTDAQRRAALIRASEYVDKRFGARFRGLRFRKRQGLEWPRLNAFDEDEWTLDEVDLVPRQLKKAVAEYALRAVRLGELNPDPTRLVPSQDNSDPNSGTTAAAVNSGVVVRERVGPIETEYADRSDDPHSKIPEYPAADAWLAELIEVKVSGKVRRA